MSTSIQSSIILLTVFLTVGFVHYDHAGDKYCKKVQAKVTVAEHEYDKQYFIVDYRAKPKSGYPDRIYLILEIEVEYITPRFADTDSASMLVGPLDWGRFSIRCYMPGMSPVKKVRVRGLRCEDIGYAVLPCI